MSDLPQIVQVLLLFDEKASEELGPALWAALLEIERFYNLDQPRASFLRYYVSSYVPKIGALETAWRGVGRLFRGGRASEDALDLLSQEQRLEREVSAEGITGRYAKRTYDQRKLGARVLELVAAARDPSHLLIVTDREITPPPDWRYIIWDAIDGGAVVSVAPTDPKYWRERDPHRVATVKHRVRTAGLSISGQLLGLERCDNPHCFLYADVDSVTTLDLMTELGAEHELPRLVGRGFEPVVNDPGAVQAVVERPQAKGGELA